MVRRGVAVIAALAATLSLGACSASDRTADGVTELTLWHSSGGDNAAVVDGLVAEFNESHKGKIRVRTLYQGSYEDAITKLSTSVSTGNLPDVMQVNDANSAYMADTGLTVPVEQLNEAAGSSYQLDELVEAARTYYSRAGRLESMPFQASQPFVLVNPELAGAAGLSLEKPPASIDDLVAWARAIREKTGKRGISFHIHPWWFEEWTAALGVTYCTPGNGLSDQLPTAFTMSTDEQVHVWTEFQKLYADGVALNVGTDGSRVSGPFGSGEVGMVVASSAGLSQFLRDARGFEPIGVPFPTAGSNGGAVIGGNSLWVLGDNPKGKREQAAWEFVTFMASASSQRKVFTEGGYLPSSKKAIADLVGSTDPVRHMLLEQYENTPASEAAAGCHSGALQAQRTDFRPVMEAILLEGADVKASLEKAEKKSASIIAGYNKRAELTKEVDR